MRYAAEEMLAYGDAATAQTIALVVTWVIAVGGVATAVIVYIIAQVFTERRQNREHRERGS